MHAPVLLQEVIRYINCAPGKNIIDATLNGGGHSKALIEHCPGVKILGIEFDPVLAAQFARAHPELAARVTVVNDSYTRMKEIVQRHAFAPDGILFDLGLSSWHYEGSGRGFSFQRDEPLDMRFNPEQQTLTAAQIANTYSREQLSQILKNLGEEQFAEEIAANMVRTRRQNPILTSDQLSSVIKDAVPKWYQRRKIHCATKTFQALRIAVNDELGNVRLGLAAAVEALNPSGRLLVISFHGLEDKIVRDVFKTYTDRDVIRWVTRRTVRPTWDEIRQNPRARSAKMKICEKL